MPQVKIVLEGDEEAGWTASLVELDGVPYRDDFKEMGVPAQTSGRSGWEALKEMARRFGLAGFLE